MQLVIRINQEILGSLNTIPPRSQEASPQDLVWGSDIGCNLSWKNLGKPLYDGWGSSLVVMALHNIAVDLVRSEWYLRNAEKMLVLVAWFGMSLGIQ